MEALGSWGAVRIELKGLLSVGIIYLIAYLARENYFLRSSGDPSAFSMKRTLERISLDVVDIPGPSKTCCYLKLIEIFEGLQSMLIEFAKVNT